MKHSDFDCAWEKIVTGVVETTCRQNFQSLKKVDDITEGELTDVIQKLKHNKAPGYDAITSKHLIQADGVASPAIASCMQEILETGLIPENLKFGLITPVYQSTRGMGVIQH